MEGLVEDVLNCLPVLRGQERYVTPLRGGLTDQHFLVNTASETYVLRIGSNNRETPHVNSWVQDACARAAAELRTGPPVIDFLPEYPALLTRFVPGRLLHPVDVREPAVLSRIVDSLRRCHNGPPGAGSYSPFTAVRDYYAEAWNRQVPFPPAIGDAIERLAIIEDMIVDDDALCPCHNNVLASKLVDDGSKVVILDWEYGGMGDRFADLGNLAANNDFTDAHERLLLTLYFGNVQAEHLHKLRLMRLASDMREALWGFFQSGISPLEYDFLDYARFHLRRFLTRSDVLGIRPFVQREQADSVMKARNIHSHRFSAESGTASSNCSGLH